MNATEYVRHTQSFISNVHVSDWLLKYVNSSEEYSRN